MKTNRSISPVIAAGNAMPHTLNPIPKHLCLLLIFLLANLSFAQTDWSKKADTKWYDGSKVSFTLTTPEQLAGLAQLVNAGNSFSGKTIVLGDNIELNNTEDWDKWSGEKAPDYSWTPIGTGWDDGNFQGTFDGNGYVVSGIYINNDGNSQGLFGILGNGGTVQNIGVIASYIYGYDNVGILAGYNYGGTIRNCYVSGKVHGYGSNSADEWPGGAGGLVGNALEGYDEYNDILLTATIINCYSAAIVSGTRDVGGLLGHNSTGGSGVIITNSYYDSKLYLGGGYGTPKTTEEMQDNDFVSELNLVATSLSMNEWVYSEGEYPVLSIKEVLDMNDYFIGDGTEKEPYIITTKEELEYLAEFVNNGYSFEGSYFELGNDIKLSDDEWTAIGNYAYNYYPVQGAVSNPFSGTFDGKGYVISNVNINNSSENQGLFGYVLGTIKNLGVVSSSVKGGSKVGILAGCLGGQSGLKGSVVNSYAIGEVSGSSSVGGLVGSNEGTITNSYAVATVPATGSNIGKLAGENTYNNNYTNSSNAGTVSNSYYNSQTSGNNNAIGTAKTAAEMQSGEFALVLSLGASSLSMNAWEKTDEYPALTSQIAGQIQISEYLGGSGTSTAPYIITTREELAYLAVFVNNGHSFEGNYFKLGNNIELNENSATDWQSWDDANAPDYAWNPIGIFSQYYDSGIWEFVETSNPFSGTFDGDGKTISGVYINNSSSYQSLFGYIGTAGTIKNLGVINSYIKGRYQVGGLAGQNNGNISSSYAAVSISSSQNGSSGDSYFGGLVGYNGGTISNSYATGSVSAFSDVGGLVGYNGGSISNSYSTGAVSGSNSVGGLVGYNGGSISNSYYDIGTSGQPDKNVECEYNWDIGKLECNSLGRSTEDMKNAATFVLGGWDFTIWTIDSEVNSGYPFHRTTQLPSIAAAQVEFNNQRLTENGTPTTLIQIGSSSLEATLKSAALGQTALVEGTDYQVFYADNSEVGTAKLAILGIGNYSGAAVFDYYITENARDMENATVEPILEQLLTDPDPIPVVKDYFGCNLYEDFDGEWRYSSGCVSVILAEGIDYNLTYSKPATGDGKATIYIVAVNPGIYDNFKIVEYSVVGSKNLSEKGSIAFVNPGATYTYNGKPHTPEVVVSYEGTPLVYGQDYELSYSENINAGIVTITATGTGDFIGEQYEEFTISAQSIATSNSNIQVDNIRAVLYETGVVVQPELVIMDMERGAELKVGTDYTANYLPYTGPTTQATILVAGTGNYSGSRTVYFTVTAEEEEIIEIEVTWQNLEFTYDGTEKQPTATATLEGASISLYVNTIGGAAINASSEYYTARATFATPNSLWELTNATVQFKINKAEITGVTLSISDVNIGGTPSPSVSGKPDGLDVVYLYSLNQSSGYAEDVPTETGVYFVKAVITETSNYLGYETEPKSFLITNPDAIKVAVDWTQGETFTYNGAEQHPTASAPLTGGGFLNISITGATNAGTHTAVARLANSSDENVYELQNARMEFTIAAKTLAENAIDPIGDKASTGSQLTPSVVVKDGATVLVLGTDYEVSYGANLTGTGTVTVTGKGNYKGTAAATFTINENPEITEPIDEPDPCEEDSDSCDGQSVILPQIALGQVSIQRISGGILLENLPSNAKVEIFNLQGKQVYSAMSVDAQCIVPLQAKGMYIVKVGTQTFRAAVR